MLEVKKISAEFEKLTVAERTALLMESSVSVLAKLHLAEIPGVDPVSTLVGFILGSTLADGEINEREYLLIYPSLVRTFGSDFDFASVKESFKKDKNGKKMVKQYTQNLAKVIATFDEDVIADVITLCLCVLSVDGKVTLRERNYLRQLLKSSCDK